MKRRLFGIITALCLICTLLLISAFAGIDNGPCGEALSWRLDDAGTLTIEGTGRMWDLTEETPLWLAHKNEIVRVRIGGGVSSLGADAFRGCALLESVSIPQSLAEIGSGAFADTPALRDVFYAGPAGAWSAIAASEGAPGGFAHVNCTDPDGHYTAHYVIKPTCTEEGYTVFVCPCGHSYRGEFTEALGHDYIDWYPIKMPTCTGKGIERHDCNRCSSFETREIPATGHHYDAVVTAPTCTEKGFTTYTCVCGESYVGDETAPLGHAYGEWVETKAPTCTENGTERRDCSRCDQFETREIAAGHHYAAVVTAPTCTEKGYTTYTCSGCMSSFVIDETPALGHAYGEWHETKAPTCTEKGIEQRDCSRCDRSETREVAATGHHYTAVVTDPTCTEKGYTTYTCSACGESYVADETVPLGHAYGEWHETKAPTCTEKGTEQRDCSRCEHFETREVAATGHHYTAVVTEATCTEKGYTTYTCVCGESYVADETAPLGHAYGEWHQTKAPTCTEKGTEQRDCDRCDRFETREIAATGHRYAAVVTEPTCTEKGYTTYTCSACGESYIDNYVSAAGHRYAETVTEPTCTEEGCTTHTCSVCGDSYVDSCLAALGHDFRYRVEVAPTVMTSGSFRGVCSRCLEESSVTVPAQRESHYTVTTEKEASCTEPGIVIYTWIDRSGSVISIRAELPMLPHSYSDVVTEPTCTEEGFTTHTCAVCGESFRDSYVEALGHDSVYTVVYLPTAEKAGLILGDCARCRTMERISVPALNDTDYAVEITKEASCTEPGAAIYTWKETRYVAITLDVTIPAKQHHYEDVVTAPTCTEGGYTTHTCLNCGDSFVDSYTEAAGHSFSYSVSKAPTADSTGTLVSRCSVCHTMSSIPMPALNETDYSVEILREVSCIQTGEEKYTWIGTEYGEISFIVTLPMIPHDYGVKVTKPTCTEQGYTTYTCPVCGDTFDAHYTEPTGHTYEGKAVAPGCTEGGYTVFTCHCGDSYIGDETAPVGHKYVNTVVYPGCSNQGWTEHACSVCGDSYRDDYTPALEHDWYRSEITTPATDDKAGVRTYYCSRCTATRTEVIPHLVHKYEMQITPPTCTTMGYVLYVCSCGDNYMGSTIKAYGHDYQNGFCTHCGARDPNNTDTNPFTDIATLSKSFQTAITWANEKGIAAGATATTYNPNGSCTRGQVVTFLWRAAGKPEPSITNNPYNDVASTAYYYKAILWAAENDITAGYNNPDGSKSFRPGDTVTRGQFVTFLWRYEGRPAPTSTRNPFNDVTAGGFYSAILWGSENGIVAGYKNAGGSMSFKPNNPCTRAHVAVFLYRDLG